MGREKKCAKQFKNINRWAIKNVGRSFTEKQLNSEQNSSKMADESTEVLMKIG